MFEILSLLVGGVLRFVPAIIGYFDNKNQRQHEREMVALEMEKLKVASELRQQEKELDAIKEVAVDQNKAYIKTGKGWIDWILALVEAFSATVRPVLTYWYCVAMYGSYKVALYLTFTGQGGNWKDAVVTLWTSADYAIMLSIIGFWFVDRAIRKMGIK